MFAGILIRGSRKYPQDFATTQTVLNALTPHKQADVTGHWSNERALIVQGLCWNTAESKNEKVPEVCQATGCVIASWLRLDNRTSLCVELKLNDTPLLTDPQIVLAAYAKWRTACADKLEGDFSFVIHDPTRETTYCARDSVGAKPFFYFVDKEVFIFASTAAIFPKIKNINSSASEEWLARYFVNVSHNRVKTAFEAVLKLPSAHHLTVRNEGPVEPKQYFEFQNRAPFATTRDVKWVSRYRDLFDEVVAHRLRSDYFIGSENSGGIDSSTIIASASQQLPHSLNDFHLFGMSHLLREPEYILETPIHCGIEQNHIITAPSYFRTNEVALRGIRTLGYPAENGLTTLYHRFLEEAQLHEIRTLLSGFGGDEIVTNSGEKFYEELYDIGAFGTLLDELPGCLPMRMARFAKVVGQRKLKEKDLRRKPYPLLTRILDLVTPEARSDLGLVESAATRPGHITEPSMNALALTQLTHGRFGGEMAGRLESFSLMAQSYRISYRWPMLDRRLIQQYLDTPIIEKRHRAIGRYIHRKAFDGDVPAKVLWKPNKAMGTFTHLERQEPHDAEALVESLPGPLDFIARDALRELGQKMRYHRSGEALMPPEDYAAGYMAFKNLFELRLFLVEWSV